MAYRRQSPQPVVEGGTGAQTFTTHGVLLGEGTSAVGVTAAGTTGQVLTGSTGADPVWASPAASSISITGNTGGALTGNAFTFTGGTTGISFGGSGTTETLSGTLVVANGGTGATTLTGVVIGNGTSAFTASAITQHDVLVGGASNAITSVAPSATSGVPLISQGASADPTFGTAVVAGGGTGITSTTAYAVLCGGTTSTAALQSIAGVGTSGQVLTSNGAGALPTFQAAGAASAPSMLGSYLGFNVASGSPQWIAPFGSSIQSTQANGELTVPFAGTAKNLYVNLGVNGIAAAATIKVNRNGSNTSIVATTTASTPGVYSDTSHTQAYSATDTIQFEIATAGGSGALTGTICLEYTT